MGIEYRLRFSFSDPNAVTLLLRRLPNIQETTSPSTSFDFLTPESTNKLPEATVTIESDGLYFCDHCGGSGRALLGIVVACMVSKFGPVAVEEL